MPLSSVSVIFQLCMTTAADCSGPVVRGRGSLRRPADIPPIDPSVLEDLHKHTQDVAQSVELMLRSLSGTIQNVSITLYQIQPPKKVLVHLSQKIFFLKVQSANKRCYFFFRN